MISSTLLVELDLVQEALEALDLERDKPRSLLASIYCKYLVLLILIDQANSLIFRQNIKPKEPVAKPVPEK